MKNNKQSLRNLAIALAVIMLALSCVETILFLKDRRTDAYYAVSEENRNVIELQAERYFEDNFFTSATNVYNAKSMYKTLNFTPELKRGYPLIYDITNETKIEDALNIVVIGDSFVWGAYSTNRNELFWRLLENDFRKDGVRVNVFGVGTTGANAYEELSWLTDYSLIEDLNPDLVIFGYVYNDSDDSVVINGNTVNWNKELPILSKVKKLFPNIFEKLIERISAETMYTNKYSDSEYISYDCAPPILKGRFYEKYKTDFVEKLDKFAATVDFPITVVTLPTIPNNKMLEALYEPLEGLYASCENVRYYNSAENFGEFASSKHNGNYSVNIADFHPGSATNRFYADYIKAFIESDFSYLIENYSGTYSETNNVIINEYLPYRVSPTKTLEDENTVTYKVEYPAVTEPHTMHGIEISSYYLVNPLGRHHIKLAFSNPINIDEIKLDGEYSDIDISYTRINSKLGYDDHNVFNFESEEKNTYTVEPTEQITAILISADFNEDRAKSRKIDITFSKSKKAGESK